MSGTGRYAAPVSGDSLTFDVARRPAWPVLVAPFLVATAIVLLIVSTAMVQVGPFDRAAFGWLVPIPMLLVAPGIAGVAARWSGERPATVAIVALAVALGLLLIGSLVATVDRIGCEPVDDKLRVLAYIAPAGIVFGVGYAAAGLVALRLRRHSIVAIVAAATTLLGSWLLTIVAGGLIFQGVSCAYVP
jgi:hypothetical protein